MSFTCHVCGGDMRITNVTTPRDQYDVFLSMISDRSAVAHCRAHPAHNTGDPYLSAILQQRAALSPDEWARHDRMEDL